MLKTLISGAAAAALMAGAAHAATSALPPLAWIITPGDGACETELDLTGGSGAVFPVTLTSDGEIVSLHFKRVDLPERAFLPIRIDQKRYSNLMLRGPDGQSGELILSEETEAALRKGGMLAVAWLGGEPLSGSLEGSRLGVTDLKTCGAQAAVQHRARVAAEAQANAKAEADARAKAIADAQVEAARAQAAAAEAERQRVAAEAERQRRAEAAEQDRLYAQQRQREYEDAQRRDYEAAQRRAYDDGYYEPRYVPPPQPSYYPGWRRY
jgi:hypothetical protein